MNADHSSGTGRSLVAFCPLGLANRLRVLLSGMALAEATRRRFTMLWPRMPACAAPFAELFAGDWPVETVRAQDIEGLPYLSGWFATLPDLLLASESRLVVGHPTWLIRPEAYPGHDRLMDRCRELFARLEPVEPILRAVEDIRMNRFRPSMIGVHLRRGDMLRERPDVAGNTARACAAVDRFLREDPDAGILLCTDDGAVDPGTARTPRREGLREQFRLRYGERVVMTTPRSVDRRTPGAIQDALADLWLLRATDRFVGTRGSSFSELAVFGRPVPQVLTAGATPGYRRFARLAIGTGFYRRIARRGRRELGRALPMPVLVRLYVNRFLGWLRGLAGGKPSGRRPP